MGVAAGTLPLPVTFGLQYRLPKCCTTGVSKFPSSGFAACLRYFKTNRAFVPISITMAGRGLATVVFASGTDPQSEGDLTDGPPISTILAGLVVFLLFLWLMGSLVLWILRLFVG
ncbi:unnamed protein product [Victoria cruziana]